MFFKMNRFVLCTVILVVMTSTGLCENVRLAYTNNSTSVVTTNIVKAVLEKLSYSVEMIGCPSDELWETIASGRADAMVSAWLPKSHSSMLKKYENRVEVLKPIMLGSQIGFVTPTYVTIENIDGFKAKASRFDNKIYCIKDHIGSIEMTKRAIKAYGLKGVKCVLLSEKEMLTKIEKSVKQLEWIALGAWSPNIIFSKWKLKFLEDPKNIFDKDEKIFTVATTSLKNEHRDVHAFLMGFFCSHKELQKIMETIAKSNEDPYDAAKNYIQKNPEKYKNWVKDVKKGHQKRRFHLN